MRKFVFPTLATGVLASLFFWGSAVPAPGSPGDGINLSDWLFRPYVDVAETYDSNIFLEQEDGESDYSLTLEYGLLTSRSTETLDLSLRLWGLEEWFHDVSTADHSDFGDDLNLTLTTPGGTEILLRQSYAELEDIDYTTASMQDIRRHDAEVEATRELTEKTSGELGYTFRQRDYDEAGLFDWRQHLIGAEVDYEATDKADLYIRADTGIQDGEGNDDTGATYTTLLGLKSRQTDKITASVGAGWLGLDSDEVNLDTVGFEGRLVWLATPKITVDALASRDIQPASIAAENYELVSTVQAGVGFQLLSSLKASAHLAYRNYDLQNDYLFDGELRRKEEDNWMGRLRLDYQAPATFLKLYAELRRTEQSATIDQLEYDQTLAMVGATFTY